MDVVVFLSRFLLFLYQKGNGRLVCFRMLLGAVCKGVLVVKGSVERLVWYFRPTLLQLLEGYILDFLQYYISFLKVLFQKCEQYFKLFIAYCKDNTGIVSLFIGCIICLLYFSVSQNLEVQYLVLGVLCSRFMILYIQFLEWCMFCISG